MGQGYGGARTGEREAVLFPVWSFIDTIPDDSLDEILGKALDNATEFMTVSDYLRILAVDSLCTANSCVGHGGRG